MHWKWVLWLWLRQGRFAESSKLFRQKSFASHSALIHRPKYYVSAKEESFLFVLGAYHLTVSCTCLDPSHSSSPSINQAERNVDVQFSSIRFCSSLPLISRSASSASMKPSVTDPSWRLYTRLLLTDVLGLLGHARTPRGVQSLSVYRLTCRDTTVTFPSLKFSLFMCFISSSEKRDNPGIIRVTIIIRVGQVKSKVEQHILYAHGKTPIVYPHR